MKYFVWQGDMRLVDDNGRRQGEEDRNGSMRSSFDESARGIQRAPYQENVCETL